MCGGIVIAPNAVLTAAHCVDPRTSQHATIHPNVHIGGLSSEDPIQIRKTVLAIPHPKWMGVIEDGYDLVILKLNKKTCVTPIPNLGHKKATQREDLQFFGYGRTAIGGSYSYVLQGGFFPTYTDKHCNKKYNLNPKLGKRELCVRGPVSVGVCAGDHGGPLILQPSLKKFKDVLVGIASYTSADCTETEGAAVFMDIKKYRPWIRKTLKSKRFRKGKKQ